MFHALTPGSYTLVVTNPDGGRATVPLTVTPAPNITSVSPVTVNGGVPTTVTLTGTGFQAVASIGASAGSVSDVSITPSTTASLQLTAPTSGGTVTLRLTNTDGGTDTITVTVVSAPNAISVSPNSVLASSTKAFTLSGTDFVSGATLTPSSGSVSGFTVTNATTATVTFVAPAAAGTVTLTFRNSDGGFDTITVAVTGPPIITSTSPTAVGAGVTVGMSLTGSGFQTPGATLSANNGATLSGFTVTSSTTATVNFTAPASAGTVTLTLTNPDGGTTTKTVTVNAAPTHHRKLALTDDFPAQPGEPAVHVQWHRIPGDRNCQHHPYRRGRDQGLHRQLAVSDEHHLHADHEHVEPGQRGRLHPPGGRYEPGPGLR